jgi:hypothetical protein
VADEQVRYDILVEAKAAIKQLREMSEAADSVQDRVSKFTAFLAQKSRAWNVPVQQLLNTFKQLNAEMAKQKTQTIFGNVGGKNIFNLSEQYLKSAQAAGRFKVDNDGVVKSIQNVKGQMDVAEKSVKKTGDAMDGAGKKAQGFRHGIDVVRTALGTLLAVGIFQFLAALQAVFTEFTHNLRETELAIYNLINAEKRLSEGGIDVTPKGLEETIEAVRELVPILSQIQAEELVSRIATNVAPSLKLTNEQIRQMAEATALLYVRNKALGKSFDEVESQLTNAFLTGKVSVGINNLGVKISDQIVRDEALRLGLVKTEKQFDSLTGEMEAQIKAAAMLSVVYKNATQDIGSIDEYMETTDAQIERVKTAWSDLLTLLGSVSGTGFAKFLGFVGDSLQGWIMIITEAKPYIAEFFALQIAGWQTLGYVMEHPFTNLAEAIDKFKEFKDANIAEMMKGLGDAVDTPTAAVEDLGDAIDALDVDGLKEKIEDIIEDTQNAREDLAENLTRKLEDLDEEYRRKAIDAEEDYRRKVEDINRDAERDIARIKENHREQDQRDEERYQLQLWELRMRFLMDLEDALHARDARQVIRLQKQYALDKEALRRKHELEGREREDSQRNELEDIERRRQERLADARLEYEQKLADQRVAKQRELEDLATWYAREQADIEEAQKRKMETLLKGWIDEQKITEANASEVYKILQKYFGPGGMTDALYQYMMDSLVASTQNAVNAAMSSMPTLGIVGGGVGGGGHTVPLTSSPPTTSTRGGRGKAEGGTLIATRPTNVLFGEAGAEAATFTPLTRIGRNEGKVDVSGSLDALGMDGKIAVDLYLSPDLEARVVENSMNGVAEAIVKINRTKV